MNELIKIDKELKALSELKSASLQIAEKCNNVKITDDVTYAVGVQIFSDANKTLKAIEEKRKELKEPYLDAGKKIDGVAKEISEALTVAVTNGKKEALAYSQKQEQERQAELKRINDIKESIIQYKQVTLAAIDRCSDESQLVEVNQQRIAIFPADKEWMEFAEDAKIMRRGLFEYAKAKKVALTQPFETEEAHQVMSQIEEQIVEQTEDIAHEEIASVSLKQTSGIRKNWKFKVVDFSKVPDAYKVIDETKVREWAKQMREANGLVDHAVHFGIEHYIEESMTLK